MADSSKMIKNSFSLYFRMILLMGVNLYTSRVILRALGVEDFGIYGVVGSLVTMFSFINSGLLAASQRFLSYDIGKNESQLPKTFGNILVLNFLLAIFVVLISETAGIIFFNKILNIPPERINAARISYHFTIVMFSISIIQVPFNSLILAYEKMNFYAVVSIFDGLLKLAIAFCISYVEFDKLILYSFLLFIVSLFIFIFYIVLCKLMFRDIKIRFAWDKNIIHDLLSFSGWSLLGSFSWVSMMQSTNILINIFWGPVVNAARSLSMQMSTAVVSFIANTRNAVDPQIIKTYASGKKEEMIDIVFSTTRYTFLIIYFLFIPIIINIEFIIKLWLGTVPPYTVSLARLAMIVSVIQSIDISLGVFFKSTGNVKFNQIFSSIVYVFVIPFGYLFFKRGMKPESIMYLQIIATIFVSFLVKVILIKKDTSIKMAVISIKIFKRVLVIIVLSLVSIFILHSYVIFTNNKIFIIILDYIIVFSLSYFFGLENKEKKFIKEFILRKVT